MSGEKKEEYREIKPYWDKRLYDVAECGIGLIAAVPKPFTHVLFINGYGDDKPRVEKEIECIDIGKPRKGWCPDDFLGKEFFVISFK